MLTPWQKLITQHYGGGDFAHIETVAESQDVEDTLFTFLMIELDPKEDCDDWPEALSRVDAARRQLEEVEDLFKMHAPYITERQRDRDNPPKFAPGDRVHIRKVGKTKTVVSVDRTYGHELRYVLKGAKGVLDEGWREDELQLVERRRVMATIEHDCGQCCGTGRTQSASNLEDEECPVCDGTGKLPTRNKGDIL